jgi:hypothetical protein
MKFELGDKTKDIWCGELVRRIGAANWFVNVSLFAIWTMD